MTSNTTQGCAMGDTCDFMLHHECILKPQPQSDCANHPSNNDDCIVLSKSKCACWEQPALSQINPNCSIHLVANCKMLGLDLVVCIKMQITDQTPHSKITSSSLLISKWYHQTSIHTQNTCGCSNHSLPRIVQNH